MYTIVPNFKLIIMKTKVILLALFVGFGSMISAQNDDVLTNKNGAAILPSAGDWGLGFDAAPILNYAGNMLNGNTMNSMGAAFDNSNFAISGKYFTDASTAYRGSLRIGMGSMSADQLFGGVNGDSLTNTTKMSSNIVVLGGGLEKRRGHGRLQGYYGGEMLVGFGGSKDSYTYAEELSNTNQVSRITEENYGSTFVLGLRGVIGVEYFILPKISLGAEYGWGLSFASQGQGSSTTESWNSANSSATTTTVNTGGGSIFGIDTDNNGGAIRLMFHF